MDTTSGAMSGATQLPVGSTNILVDLLPGGNDPLGAQIKWVDCTGAASVTFACSATAKLGYALGYGILVADCANKTWNFFGPFYDANSHPVPVNIGWLDSASKLWFIATCVPNFGIGPSAPVDSFCAAKADCAITST